MCVMSKPKCLVASLSLVGCLSLLASDIQPTVSGSTYTFTVGAGETKTFTEGLTGTGITLVKTGLGKLTLTGDAAYQFSGAIQVQQGTLAAAPKCFMYQDSADNNKWKSYGKPTVTITKGACFDITGGGGADWAPGQPFGNLSIAGAGPDGEGALVRLNNATSTGSGCDFLMFGNCELTDDATIKLGCRFRNNHWLLKGYKLTKKGAGNWYFYNVKIIPGERAGGVKGQIDVLGGDISWQLGDWEGDADTRLLFDGCSKLTLYANKGAGSVFCPYSIVVTNTAVSIVADTTGTVTGGNRFTGPITLYADLTAVAQSGRGLTFEGKISANLHKVTTSGSGSVWFKGGADCRIDTNWVASFNPTATYQYLTGTEPYYLDGQFNNAKRITIDNASFVRFGDSFSSQFSFSGSKSAPACLAVTNSVVKLRHGLLLGFGSDVYAAADFGPGSTVTNNNYLRVGGYDNNDHRINARVNQSDATLVTSARIWVGLGEQNYGYYRLQDGLLEASADISVGNQGGTGVFRMDGGTLQQANNILSLGDAGTAAGQGVFRQGGGTATTRINFGSASAPVGSSGLVLLEGAATTNVCGSSEFRFSPVNAYTGVLAVNDGAYFRVQRILKTEAARTSGANHFTLSLDGGVLAQTWSGEFHQHMDDPIAPPDEILVHTNGVVLAPYHDSRDDVQYADSYPSPFVAPQGKVVRSIALPTDAAFAADTYYMGPPTVTITGAGAGAAAVAEYDEATRTVTGIRVVAPGTGYAAGTTATIASSDRTATYTCAVTLADAPTTGKGLTVDAGPRIVSLKGTNTYHGVTTVKSGTLKLALREALPTGSGLVVAKGAVADLSALNFSVPTLEAAGVVSNGNLTVTQALTFPLSTDTAARMTGGLTLADGVQVVVRDLGEPLVPGGKYVLLTAEGGITCAGAVTFVGVPEKMTAKMTAKTISVYLPKGLQLIFR